MPWSLTESLTDLTATWRAVLLSVPRAFVIKILKTRRSGLLLRPTIDIECAVSNGSEFVDICSMSQLDAKDRAMEFFSTSFEMISGGPRLTSIQQRRKAYMAYQRKRPSNTLRLESESHHLQCRVWGLCLCKICLHWPYVESQRHHGGWIWSGLDVVHTSEMVKKNFQCVLEYYGCWRWHLVRWHVATKCTSCQCADDQNGGADDEVQRKWNVIGWNHSTEEMVVRQHLR